MKWQLCPKCLGEANVPTSGISSSGFETCPVCKGQRIIPEYQPESTEGEDARPMQFGDYCIIEQHRYGCDNEHYIHKVIGTSRSNSWVDVPVMHKATQTIHDHMEDVVSCICCGVCETEVLKYRQSDVKIIKQSITRKP